MSTSAIRHVAVIGCGTIGASWAAFYALRGLRVTLFDAQPQTHATAEARARQAIASTAALGLATPEQQRAATLHPCATLAEAVAGADLVQESVLETYPVKHAVLAELDAATRPDCLIASSSSGLLISELQRPMARPRRAFIAHPFNPPHLVPLVELVGGRQTDPAVIEQARAFYAAHGKVPVVLHQEVPGHIANRLAAALWREAIELVAQGVASVEDVDRALCAGPGLRWAIMGQHMIYHLGGGPGGYGHFIDHIGKAFEEYWRTMPTWTSIPPAAREAIVAGVHDATAGRAAADLIAERDRKLAALLQQLYPPPPPVAQSSEQ
jgi:3-hydroxyacyl-CoA dehydrogenase